jgi:hypothetical protein
MQSQPRLGRSCIESALLSRCPAAFPDSEASPILRRAARIIRMLQIRLDTLAERHEQDAC